MIFPVCFPIASIEAARPVFMIVMGVFLMLVAWRMAKESEGWTARFMVSGAFLLFFGYAFLIPMYEAGKIEKVLSGGLVHNSSIALAWHAVKLVAMNVGWLFFGLGIGLHSGLIRVPALRKSIQTQTSLSHEPIA